MPFFGLTTLFLYLVVKRSFAILFLFLTDKKILIQGPNTLAAFLDTIRAGHHYLKLNETAGKVAKVVRGIQKEFSNFDVSTESAMKKLDGALKDIQKLQTRINVLGRTLEKGAENLEEEN